MITTNGQIALHQLHRGALISICQFSHVFYCTGIFVFRVAAVIKYERSAIAGPRPYIRKRAIDKRDPFLFMNLLNFFCLRSIPVVLGC